MQQCPLLREKPTSSSRAAKSTDDPKAEEVSVLESSLLDRTNMSPMLGRCCYPRCGRDLADLAALAIQDNELSREPALWLSHSTEHVRDQPPSVLREASLSCRVICDQTRSSMRRPDRPFVTC